MDTLPINVGVQKQLFVDDFVIESMDGVKQVLNQPTKYPDNPVLRPEKAWEWPRVFLDGSVIYDKEQKLFKMWYWAISADGTRGWYAGKNGMSDASEMSGASHGTHGCYAVSEDGIHWERPNLGILDFQGSKDNNMLLWLGMGMVHSPDDPDPSRRYKAFAGKRGAFSPDGIHWSVPENSREIPGDIAGDNLVPFCYDELTNRYVAFGKVIREFGGMQRRAVSVSFSDDFLEWTMPETILVPDARDDELARERVARYRDRVAFVDDLEWPVEKSYTQFYGMSGFPYEGMYLGMPWVFDISGWCSDMERIRGLGGEDGVMMLELTSSRDLLHWNRVCDHDIFLPIGEPRTWDSGRIYTTVNRPIIVGDEIWIYYGGSQPSKGHPLIHEEWWNQPREDVYKRYPGIDFNLPIHSIGLAKLRLDGWVSADAGQQAGILTTKPIVFVGSRLVINADARRGGVAVEILNEAGHAIPGFGIPDCRAFTGDSVRHDMEWSGGIGLDSLRGKPVHLRFQLANAKLYSFVFVP